MALPTKSSLAPNGDSRWLPKRIDLKVARVTGMLTGERFADARDVLLKVVDEESADDIVPALKLLLAVAEAGLGRWAAA